METVVCGAAIYVVLLVIVRLSGRRTLAQMTAFDLVLILICAETTQQALLADDFSVTNAVILIVTLFALDIALSFVKRTWPFADRVLEGVPTILVADGKPDEHAGGEAGSTFTTSCRRCAKKRGWSGWTR